MLVLVDDLEAAVEVEYCRSPPRIPDGKHGGYQYEAEIQW